MKRVGITVAAVLLLIALPLSSQESASASELPETLQKMLKDEGWSPEQIRALTREQVNWDQAGSEDAELLRYCLRYMKETHEGIGPEVRAGTMVEVATMAQKMRALGFTEQQIVRTALNGTREVLAELEKLQERDRVRTAYETGLQEMIRNQFEKQLQGTMYQQSRHEVRERARDEKASRPDDLMVPPGPQRPGPYGN
jgi:hypothetical protein